MTDMIQIQIQDETGNWRTHQVVNNLSQIISLALKALKNRFPNQRVRAVDMNGRLVDLM